MDGNSPVMMMTMVLDCPDPKSLARFYSDLSGFVVVVEEDDWVQLDDPTGTPRLAFQRVDDYRAPNWPDQDRPQQAHLDFLVPDLEKAMEWAVAMGAQLSEQQPGDDFGVFLDPAGHPFCLVQAPVGLVEEHA